VCACVRMGGGMCVRAYGIGYRDTSTFHGPIYIMCMKGTNQH